MKSTNRRTFLKSSALGVAGLTVSPNLSQAEEPKVFHSSVANAGKPLNVIWITCDEMNSRAMSIYGNKFTSMPAAEQMAREGISFSRAYVQMPKCVPSRCSMITGRYPHCEGHRTLSGRKHYIPHRNVARNWDFTLRRTEPNLITFLRDRRYRTALIGKNHLVDWNLHKAWFDATSKWDSAEWDNRGDPHLDDVTSEPRRAHFRGRIKPDYDYDRHADSLAAKWTIEFIRTNKDRPFFALLDVGLPHPPYAEFTKMPAYKLPLEEIPVPKSLPLDKVPSVERAKRTSYDLEGLTDDERRRVRRAYYTMCEFADRNVKKVIHEVDRLGLAEKTLIIYSADHGDFNGSRNMYEKWDTSFYEEIVNVPLIMRLPGTLPAGRRIDNLVEFVDIVPTIMELKTCEVPRWVQGKSLLDLAMGKTDKHKDAVFSQGGVEKGATLRPAPYENPRGGFSPKQKVLCEHPEAMIRSKMIRTDRYKYIYRLEGDCEMYDLQTDPDELRNLAYDQQYKDLISELKDRMLRFTIETETNLPEIDKLMA